MSTERQGLISLKITIYIYFIHTPNLGFAIAVPGRESEQDRFRESSEGAEGSTRRALGRSKRREILAPRKLNLAALYSAIVSPVLYPVVLSDSAYCCLSVYSFAGSWFHLVPIKNENLPLMLWN